MARIFREPYNVKLPQRGREAEHDQYWREEKGMTKCPTCGNVHYRKRWYVSPEEVMGILMVPRLPITKKRLCPACKMVKDHQFEGELFVEDFPSRHRKELLRLIRNYGERARLKDAQHRIIDIEETKNGYRVTTTENQLADKLAKKIKGVFNKVNVRFSHSAEPAEVDRVHAKFYGT